MSDERDPSPRGLLPYYERLAADQPDLDQWAHGAAVIRRWIALVEAGRPTQAEVSGLLDDIGTQKDPGSMFGELWSRVRNWAHREGFDLGRHATHHPWWTGAATDPGKNS
jgi:hypothetical protein